MTKKTLYFLFLMTYFLWNSAYAESIVIYKYIDDKGVIHLTNKAPNKKKVDVLYSRSYVIKQPEPEPEPVIVAPKPKQKKQVKKSSKRNKKWAKSFKKLPKKYKRLITEAAADNKLHPALVHAVIRAESSYNPKAISSAGAVGLMQLMPGTAKRYGVTDRTDPQDNIKGGTKYLRDLLDMFNGDTKLALAAYNAGENAVKRYNNKIPPYKETRNYVVKVMKFYKNYLSAMM